MAGIITRVSVLEGSPFSDSFVTHSNLAVIVYWTLKRVVLDA